MIKCLGRVRLQQPRNLYGWGDWMWGGWVLALLGSDDVHKEWGSVQEVGVVPGTPSNSSTATYEKTRFRPHEPN